MKIETLMESLPDSFTAIDRELVQRAYKFAEKAHLEQRRASGEPYITHCVAVAAILAEMQVPPAVVAAGLLHDTVEDTPIKLTDLQKEFGEEIAGMVDGVTKLSSLPQVTRSDTHQDDIDVINEPDTLEAVETTTDQVKKTRLRDMRNETLRKTFLAMGEDIRVVLIKLADRLHNMRTLGFMPEQKRKQVAQETMDIFAPLANRLGLWSIKWELEDLSFRHVNPEKYKEIAENLNERRSARETQIEEIINKLSAVLSQSDIKAEISGRPKHIYSIYRKMVDKGKPFEMVRDLRGVRLIVEDVPSCYAALGVIHNKWRPLPQEFDDYIDRKSVV